MHKSILSLRSSQSGCLQTLTQKQLAMLRRVVLVYQLVKLLGLSAAQELRLIGISVLVLAKIKPVVGVFQRVCQAVLQVR